MQLKSPSSKRLLMALGVAASGALIAALPSRADDQTPPSAQGAHQRGSRHGDPAAAMQQRLEKLKAELNIQPNQEGAWQAYAAKVKEQGDKMKALHQQAGSDANVSLPERLDRQAEFMKQRQAAMEEIDAALKALYAALTPEQRTILDQHFSRGRHHQV